MDTSIITDELLDIKAKDSQVHTKSAFHSHHSSTVTNEDNATEPPLPMIKKLKVRDDNESFAFQIPTKQCIQRIHNDLRKLYRDPIEGIFVVPDDERTNRCHALIFGVADTPYEFGFFYFVLDFPNEYPHVPPRVILQTTGGGSVRFNPNLYSCGKVCLSILGTWSGPSWTPALNIGSILLSIQSLMSATPYHNEPGFETVNLHGKEPRNYNHIIRHETIRVAVLGMVDLAKANKLPEKLAELVLETFQATWECCLFLCEEYKTLDGHPFRDPYKKNTGKFHFMRLRRRLKVMGEDLAVAGEEAA